MEENTLDKKKTIKRILSVLGVFAGIAIVFCVKQFVGTSISYSTWQTILMAIIINVLFSVSLFKMGESAHIAFQILIPDFLLAVFWNASLASSNNTIYSSGFTVILTIEINLMFIVTLITMFRGIGNPLNRIKSFLCENVFEIIICILFVILSLQSLNVWLSPGGFDYFGHISEYIGNWKNYSLPLDQLKICGHTCQSYGFFMGIGAFLTPGSVAGPRVIQIIMGVITIICYGLIIKRIFRKIPVYMHNLLVAAFAFSPLFFGIISELNPDFAVLCFIVWLICARVYGVKILECFCAVLLCLSKESGIAIYGMYMIAIVITKFVNSKKNIRGRLADVVFDKQIILNIFAGLFYLILHFSSAIGTWGETASAEPVKRPVNVIGIDTEYMVYKLKMLLSPNFLWIYLLVFFIGIILLIISKVRLKNIDKVMNYDKMIWLSLISCLTGFCVVHFFYITWTNYRYVLPYVFFANILYAFGMAVICNIKNKTKIKNVVMYSVSIIILLITFASNYYTFDYVFSPNKYTFDVGKDKMCGGEMFYLDGKEIVSDDSAEKFASIGMVYNREYTGLGNAIEKGLKDIGYTKNDLVILPYRFDTYVSYNNFLYRRLDYGADNLYWNKKDSELTVNYALTDFSQNPDYQKFNVAIIKNYSEYMALKNNYENIYVFELPFYDSRDIQFDYRNMAVEVSQYSSMNYILKVYRIK